VAEAPPKSCRPTNAFAPAARPRATFNSYAALWSNPRSRGFDMNPVSIRIDGTFAQLKPVRSERGVRPRFAARVAAMTERWTIAAARRDEE